MYKFLPSGVFTIEPYSSGSLSGLNFSIKDNINIAQYKTSYGSPSWQVNLNAGFGQPPQGEQLTEVEASP
ncbi:hypothetical protein COP73_24340, partial [Salmonella enterica]|nr:hypothetical protein [Salmonella enterica]